MGMQTFHAIDGLALLRPGKLASGRNSGEHSAPFGIGKSKSCSNLDALPLQS